MKLKKLFAFKVLPSRHDSEPVAPEGGQLPPATKIATVLEDAARPLESVGIPVLMIAGQGESHLVLESIKGIAFGRKTKPLEQAKLLATRLASQMDQRSSACLLVAGVFVENSKTRVCLWVFPKDSAFRFDLDEKPRLELLQDLFSSGSSLRKAARFDGFKGEARLFHQGRVLDFQAQGRLVAANYWMKFLDVSTVLSGELGTRKLVERIQKTLSTLRSPVDRQQLFAATVMVISSPRKEWSVGEVAKNLSAGTRELFLGGVSRDEVNAVFEVDKGRLQEELRFRIFELETGVFVSSPFSAVGSSVKVEGEVLTCQGRVLSERVRKRPG